MNDTLRTQNLLPTTEPYSALPRFSHVGGETVNGSVLAVTGNNAIVDWVLVELRSSADPTQLLATRAALVQRDGDVVEVDGVSPVAFANRNPGSYYVAVGQRNHLRVMTAAPVTVNTTSALLNFTAPGTATYGANAQAAVGSVRALWTGDANGDNRVINAGPNNDRNAILTRVLTDPGNPQGNANYVVTGYAVTDLNLDGNTLAAGPNNDLNVLLNTIFSHPGNTSYSANYVVQEQAPAGVLALPSAPVIALPADLVDVASYIIQDTDFTTVMSAAEQASHWQQGVPVPAISYALSTPPTAQRPAKPGLLAPVPAPKRQTPQTGWHELYSETFDGGFPTPTQYNACAFELRAKNNDYDWGRSTAHTYENSAAAAWPAAGGNLGPQQQPGSQTYPENLQTQMICRFAGLDATNLKNFMVEFALWMDEGQAGDRFFVGFNTGEMAEDPNDSSKQVETFYGRVWLQTPLAADGNHTWQRYRFFYPELADKVRANNGTLAVMWSFQSDSIRQPNAQGAWLDSLRAERYLQPGPPSGVASCELLATNDITKLQVPGAPGSGMVSKGLNLAPYVDGDYDLAVKMARLQATDTQWVRLEFTAQPSAFIRLRNNTTIVESIDLKHFDELIDNLCANHIAILGLIDYTSVVDQSWKEGGVISPTYLEQFKRITEILVSYYDDRIKAWEIWNEPDATATALPAVQYTNLLVEVSPIIRAANDLVVFGGLVSADSSARDYLRAVYTALDIIHNDIATPFDVFAVHPYPSRDYVDAQKKYLLAPTLAWKKESPHIFRKFQTVLLGDNALTRNDSNKETWVTEFGWNAAKGSTQDQQNACLAAEEVWVTLDEQASYLASGFDILLKETAWPGENRQSITKAFWYSYNDTGVNLNSLRDCVAWPDRASFSWYLTYVYTAFFGPNAEESTEVPWNFGLYHGDWRPKTLTHCAFSAWPFWPDNCISFDHTVYLPVIETAPPVVAAKE